MLCQLLCALFLQTLPWRHKLEAITEKISKQLWIQLHSDTVNVLLKDIKNTRNLWVIYLKNHFLEFHKVVRWHISGRWTNLQPSGVTFPQDSVYQKLLKSVQVWQSYSKNKKVTVFFETQIWTTLWVKNTPLSSTVRHYPILINFGESISEIFVMKPSELLTRESFIAPNLWPSNSPLSEDFGGHGATYGGIQVPTFFQFNRHHNDTTTTLNNCILSLCCCCCGGADWHLWTAVFRRVASITKTDGRTDGRGGVWA